jgi:3-phytase
MKSSRFPLALLLILPLAGGCAPAIRTPASDALKPRVVTAPTQHDTDDPAIWIHPTDRAQSLVIGTDKDTDGALYAYDLDGKIVNRVGGLKRPNNVDLAYGLLLNGQPTDIVVTTEREMQRLRVFSVPDLKGLDKGDLVVFDGDKTRAPMGIALYQRPAENPVPPPATSRNTASLTMAPAK